MILRCFLKTPCQHLGWVQILVLVATGVVSAGCVLDHPDRLDLSDASSVVVDSGVPMDPSDGGIADSGTPDAGLPDSGAPDAGPPPTITTPITPTIWEGEGSGVGSSPAAMQVRRRPLMILQGSDLNPSNITSETFERLAWATNDDNTALAIYGSVPVLTDLNEGQTLMATLTVEQAGMTFPQDVEIQGLDELDTRDMGMFVTSGRYSRMTLGGGLPSPVGLGEPLVLESTAGFVLYDPVDFSRTNIVSAGPAGCDGGTPGQAAACELGGGGGLSSTSAPGSGGGGGNRTSGTVGSGEFPGAGGLANTVTSTLALLAEVGGGGGGGGSLAPPQSFAAFGRGSGGAMGLFTQGHIELADISAAGVDGDELEVVCTAIAAGGGGAGGGLFFRAWSVSGTGRIDVSGGWDGGGSFCTGRSGRGGSGYIRWSVASPMTEAEFIFEKVGAREDMMPSVSEPDKRMLGPTWDVNTEVVVRPVAGEVTLTLRGDPGSRYHVSVNDVRQRTVEVPDDQPQVFAVNLPDLGIYTVCLELDLPQDLSDPQRRSCLDFAVLP